MLKKINSLKSCKVRSNLKSSNVSNTSSSRYYKFVKPDNIMHLFNQGYYSDILISLGLDIEKIDTYYKFSICKNIIKLMQTKFMGERVIHPKELKNIIKKCNSNVFCISVSVIQYLKEKWGNKKLEKYELLKLNAVIYAYLRNNI